MNKKKKRLIAVFCLLISASGQAEEFEYEGIRYNTLTDTTVEVAQNYGEALKGDIVIPDSVTFGDRRMKVTAIGRYAFNNPYGFSTITSIQMPAGITSIGEYAFYGQKDITSIDIPESVEYIGYNALASTGLKTIVMKHAPKEMQFGVFSECASLESAVMPEGMTELPLGTFTGCRSLKEVSLPKTMTKIISAFQNCTSLESFTLPDSLKALEGGVFWGCKNLREIHWNDVIETLDGYMFYECEQLKEISLPPSVRQIPYSLFNHCTGVRRIVVPSTVTEIGYEAFRDCAALEEVVMDGVSIKWLDSNLFSGCKSLRHFDIPETVTRIGNNAFEGSGLESVILGPNVESVSYEVFKDCNSLTDIYVRSSKLNDLSEWSNIFSNVSLYFGTLYVPEGQKNDYRHRNVWKEFHNIVEENTSGKEYCLVDVKCNMHEIQVNGGQMALEVNMEIEKGEPLTVTIPKEDIYSSVNRHRFLTGVLVNGEERLQDVIDGQLTIGAVEEDLDIEVVFDTYNVSLAIYQDRHGGLEFMTELREETPVTVIPAEGYRAVAKWGPWHKTYQWDPWYETYSVTTQRTFTLEGESYNDQEININYQKP